MQHQMASSGMNSAELRTADPSDIKAAGQTKNTKTGTGAKVATLQIVASTPKKAVSRATACNQYTRESVLRLLVDSPFEFQDFSRLAKYAGTREPIAIAIVRDYIRAIRPPSGPATLRRAA